jgi:transmembrane sensor
MNDQVERHLRECEQCRETADRWEPFEAALREDALNHAPAPPTAGEIATLLAAARSRREPAGARVVALRWAGGIAALVLIGIVVVLLARPGVTAAPEVAPVERSTLEVTLHRPDRVDTVFVAGDTVEAPPDGRAVVRLGNDLLEVGPRGRVTVREGERTWVGVAWGRVECTVAPRDRRGAFLVEAGEVTVEVVGTRFAVERTEQGDVEVEVTEGTVRVAYGDQRPSLLRAGGQMLFTPDGALVPEPATPAEEPAAAVEEPATVALPDAGRSRSAPATAGSPAGLSVWREWIVEGRLGDAAAALDAHLGRQPGDTGAWSLLADCRRKQGRARAAIDAYAEVIERASAGEANRARYMAGSLAQDRLGDHAAAQRYFAAYLSAPGRKPLAAEAAVRRARSLLALGRDGEGRAVLERVLAEHAGTQAAATARRLLDQQDPTP